MWSSSFVRLPERRKFLATLVALALLVPASFAIARAETQEPASPAAPAPPAAEPPDAGAATETPKAPPADAAPETGETPKAPPADAAPETGEAPKKNLRVVYLGKEYPEPLPLSYAEKPITDKGIQGARLMLKEGNQAARAPATSRS